MGKLSHLCLYKVTCVIIFGWLICIIILNKKQIKLGKYKNCDKYIAFKTLPIYGGCAG